MSDLPDPLVPVEVDLRDFAGMWLDVDRVLKSETWRLGTSDEKSAAITLWMESWHEVPAGSLPSNDRLLAKLSQAERWSKSRAHALRGWVECNDGRLYHPVVAEKALEAWIEKLSAAISGAVGNAKRWQVDVDTTRLRGQFRVAVDRLRAIDPASRVLKKKSVVMILAGSPPESPPDVGPPSPPESPPDPKNDRPPIAIDQTGPDQTGPDQTGPDRTGLSGNTEPPAPRARKRASPPPPKTLDVAALVAEGVDPQHAADWLAVRKAKDLLLTPTAWEKAKAEAQKAGMSVADAVREAAANSWGGFRASWLQRQDVPRANGATHAPVDTAARDAEAKRLLFGASAPPTTPEVIADA